jgi:hypothetical protein
MKKKHRPRPTKHKHRPRNAATGFAPAAPRPRARSTASHSTAPHWKSILAAVAGGAGSAAIGGLIVNQQILSSEAVGIGLMLGGGATAYFSDGTPRIVGTSVAAAGAGQFALAMMNKRAVKAQDDAHKNNPTTTIAANPAPAAPAQLPPPPAVPRQRATGGGVVVDLFRDAANDLESVEDEWRYGIRDDGYANAHDSSEPMVIDLDDAA